jgi:radical SAM protein with 4Fe4S-binding SPASM domain
MCLTSPCGAGRQVIALYPSGEVGPCDSIFDPQLLFEGVERYEAEKQATALMGLLHRDVDTLKPCSTCDVKRLCNGTCPGNAHLSEGSVMNVDPFECTLNFELIRGLMVRLADPHYQPFVDYCRNQIHSRRQYLESLDQGPIALAEAAKHAREEVSHGAP